MAAPALAASMADCAICSGVTGTAGLRPGVSADPVTAHEIITLRCMPPPCAYDLVSPEAYSEDGAKAQGANSPRDARRGGWYRRRAEKACRRRSGAAARPIPELRFVTASLHVSCVPAARPDFRPGGFPLIGRCAKPSLRPSLERIRSVTRAIS